MAGGILKNENVKRSLYTIFYVFLLIFIAFVVPYFAGLSLQGFSESFVRGTALLFGQYLTNFLIYDGFLIVALACILYPITRMILLKPGQKPYSAPNPSGFRIFTASYIYEPEDSLLWNLSDEIGLSGERNFMRWIKNPLRNIVVWAIVFGIYGIFLVSYPQIAVSGVPQLTLQQLTPTSEVIFSSFVPSFAENGLLLFVFMLFMGINAYFVAKGKMSKWVYFGFAFLICIAMGLLWGSFHSIVYGNSDASFIATVIFGFMGTLITLLTGTFIPFLIWHLMNNMFISIGKLVTVKSDTIVVTGIILFLLFVSWIAIEIFISRRKTKKEISFNS